MCHRRAQVVGGLRELYIICYIVFVCMLMSRFAFVRPKKLLTYLLTIQYWSKGGDALRLGRYVDLAGKWRIVQEDCVENPGSLSL